MDCCTDCLTQSILSPVTGFRSIRHWLAVGISSTTTTTTIRSYNERLITIFLCGAHLTSSNHCPKWQLPPHRNSSLGVPAFLSHSHSSLLPFLLRRLSRPHPLIIQQARITITIITTTSFTISSSSITTIINSIIYELLEVLLLMVVLLLACGARGLKGTGGLVGIILPFIALIEATLAHI